MKHNLHRTSTSAAAILAGGLLFTGPASAAVVFSEDFEGGTNIFGMGTYTYTQGYTQPNTGVPDGGLQYAHGSAAASAVFSGGDVSLITGGITGAAIDAGNANFSFSAQFSGFLTQGDHAELQVDFLNSANVIIGAPVLLGGAAFVAALPHGQFGSYTDAAAWAPDTRLGTVPVGARSIRLNINETRLAGNASDGYIDNVVLNVNVVPEPTTMTMSGLAAFALLRRRRR